MLAFLSEKFFNKFLQNISFIGDQRPYVKKHNFSSSDKQPFYSVFAGQHDDPVLPIPAGKQ